MFSCNGMYDYSSACYWLYFSNFTLSMCRSSFAVCLQLIQDCKTSTMGFSRFVDEEAVTYLCGVIIHSLIKSNICFSEQHLCVLGMCLMALDVHHRMHGQVHQGRCLKNIYVACMATRFDYTVMLELVMCLKNIYVACMATPLLYYGFVSYGWLCVICGPFSICSLEFQHFGVFNGPLVVFLRASFLVCRLVLSLQRHKLLYDLADWLCLKFSRK